MVFHDNDETALEEKLKSQLWKRGGSILIYFKNNLNKKRTLVEKKPIFLLFM